MCIGANPPAPCAPVPTAWADDLRRMASIQDRNHHTATGNALRAEAEADVVIDEATYKAALARVYTGWRPSWLNLAADRVAGR